jgi:Holliday junction resolvase-like predicted endonuclease
MPAKDIYHNLAKKALMKEGWNITNDPLSVQFGGIDLYVDLGAEKLIAAEKDEQKKRSLSNG